MTRETDLENIDKIELEKSIERLEAIFREENRHLKNMELRKLSEVIEEKAQLISFMAEVKSRLTNQKSFGFEYNQDEEKKLIIDKYKILENLMKENLLLAGHTASAIRNILHSLNKRTSRRNIGASTYSNKGTKIN